MSRLSAIDDPGHDLYFSPTPQWPTVATGPRRRKLPLESPSAKLLPLTCSRAACVDTLCRPRGDSAPGDECLL